MDHVSGADTWSCSAEANHKNDHVKSLVDTSTDGLAELPWRKRKCEVNGTDDSPLAVANDELKCQGQKDNEGRENMINDYVGRDKGDHEREAIDRWRR